MTVFTNRTARRAPMPVFRLLRDPKNSYTALINVKFGTWS